MLQSCTILTIVTKTNGASGKPANTPSHLSTVHLGRRMLVYRIPEKVFRKVLGVSKQWPLQWDDYRRIVTMGDIVGCPPHARSHVQKKCLPVGPLPGRPPARMVGPRPMEHPQGLLSTALIRFSELPNEFISSAIFWVQRYFISKKRRFLFLQS
ncbi:hypothetical protein CEXT_605851 [Caerostris extrusa]|uniref:Uncharacterized protein n=1 Tax=Caerostris extrusa TaxID=172846 RepID=A0AAV4WMG8_CAEEX|nr:hypothetical protein CEXT_605851 [Caerostris extrusa]